MSIATSTHTVYFPHEQNDWSSLREWQIRKSLLSVIRFSEYVFHLLNLGAFVAHLVEEKPDLRQYDRPNILQMPKLALFGKGIGGIDDLAGKCNALGSEIRRWSHVKPCTPDGEGVSLEEKPELALGVFN